MPEYLTQEEAFLKCKKEGNFVIREDIDKAKIESTVIIADADLDSANTIKKNVDKKSSQWNTVYKLNYDALHELSEAFLRFDKVKIDKHQCLFAYLCEKHPELDFNWEFFEKVRTKRNGINCYGTPITYEDWKEVKVQFSIYIKKIKEEIKQRIKE